MIEEKVLFEKWQVEVIIEKEELEAKISKLSDFILSDDFEKMQIDERVRLILQLRFMQEYWSVLADRVNHFK